MGLVFGEAYKQYKDTGPDGKPIFVTEMADGSTETLTGWEADIAARHHKQPGIYTFTENPDVNDVLIKMNPDDKRKGSFKYRLKRWLYDRAYDPTTSLPGRILNKGTLPGGMLGAGVGLLGGAIADYAADKAGLDLPVNLKLLGALGLGGLGAYLGYNRKQIKEKYPYLGTALDKKTILTDPSFRKMMSWDTSGVPGPLMLKRAAMFKNPRNFILEKLQADKHLGFAEKAKLAAAVRNLPLEEAEVLKEQVREQLGVNIGATISQFIFHREHAGSLFGGLLPILGGDFAQTLSN